MPADAINYAALARELDSALAGGRIDKIVMSDKSTLMLFVRAGGVNRNLIITAATAPRCYITAGKITATDVPLSFCLHLRRHIGGGVIDKVSAAPFERILTFDITARGDLGEELRRKMIVEIMGKYSNVVLTDGELKISDALKKVSLGEGRPVLPGLKYEFPADETRFFPTDREAAERLRATTGDDDLPAVMVRRMLGLSAATAREIIAEACGGNLAEGAARLLAKPTAPVVYYTGGKPKDFSFCDYATADGERRSFPTLSAAMDEYYAHTAATDVKALAENAVRRTLNAALDKQRKKLGVFEREYAAAQDYEKERILGELITANLYRIKPGERTLTADNWYEGGVTVITLTENTPQEDAQKHFKRYQKKKRTIASLETQIADTKSATDYLESVEAALMNAATADDVAEIAEELEDAGYITRQNAKKRVAVSEPRKYVIDGFDVLVGKSNVQNDRITKEARGEDIWLHTQGFHGSHVVIKARGKEVPRSVIDKAAACAAFFSKARQSENVPVDYTQAKNVHKKKGAAPGKVDYFGAKTVYVTPAPPAE